MQKVLQIFQQIKLLKIQKVFIFFSTLLLFSSFYHFYYAKKIIPGVIIANTNVGGKNYAEAKKALETTLKNASKKLELKYNGKIYEITADALELEYDIDASLSRAFEVGRTGNVYTDSKDKIAGLVKPLLINFFYTFNNDSLTNDLNLIKGEINSEAKDASFTLNNEKPEIAPSSAGREVDDEKLYLAVISSFNYLSFEPQNIVVKDINPKIKNDALKKYLSEIEKLLNNPIKIVVGNKVEPAVSFKERRLTKSEILDFITVSFDNSGNTDGLTINKPKFEAYLDLLAQEINKLPKGKVTGTQDNRVTGFELISGGIELNRQKFAEDFKKALFDLKPSVEISIKNVDGLESKGKYGIFALLGSGKSKFTGSAAARIHNLSLAAERTGGVLIAPGTVYSFNNSVGDISGATGYDTAYIISNGRTVLGEGGGVCQTSTTLFRAVLNAGLPIVKRYPHAYRVAYYELDSPVGLDASIFQPSLDFQFKNDTPNYVLVQSFIDAQNETLEFAIYGTPDGREVKITDPVVTNVISAPTALYQDDPALARGVVRQVDFSAPGASVYFTREVTRNGKVIINDTFSSRYQAWRAVFLVGTKN